MSGSSAKNSSRKRKLCVNIFIPRLWLYCVLLYLQRCTFQLSRSSATLPIRHPDTSTLTSPPTLVATKTVVASTNSQIQYQASLQRKSRLTISALILNPSADQQLQERSANIQWILTGFADRSCDALITYSASW